MRRNNHIAAVWSLRGDACKTTDHMGHCGRSLFAQSHPHGLDWVVSEKCKPTNGNNVYKHADNGPVGGGRSIGGHNWESVTRPRLFRDRVTIRN